LPDSQYERVVEYFDRNGVTVPREYQSITPTFNVWQVGRRVGEIAFTHATDSEFAGVLFVGDGDTDQKNYDSLLLQGGIRSLHDVPILRFDSHFIAGKRISQQDALFQTESVVEDRLYRRGQKLLERKLHGLVQSHVTEYCITPDDVFGIADMLKQAKKSRR
jgi:hypothetical protein